VVQLQVQYGIQLPALKFTHLGEIQRPPGGTGCVKPLYSATKKSELIVTYILKFELHRNLYFLLPTDEANLFRFL
jgi:hypothetical protein